MTVAQLLCVLTEKVTKLLQFIRLIIMPWRYFSFIV